MRDTGALDAWVGGLVQVLVTGDSGPWVAFLEGWDDRGVVLRYTEGMARIDEEKGREPLTPRLVLFPWQVVRYVSISLENLEEEG